MLTILLVTVALVTTVSSQSLNASQETSEDIEHLGRIYGGSMVRAGEFPFVAALYQVRPHRAVCGATFLNNQWLIAAAHCTVPNRQYKVITTPNAKVDRASKLYQVDKIYKLPEYPKNSYFDIELIKLKRRVKFIPGKISAAAVCAKPDKELGIDEKTIMTAVGFGATDPSNQNTLSYNKGLKKLDVNICGAISLKSSYTYCVRQQQGHGVLPGDSGSPLVVRAPSGQWRVVGVCSTGNSRDVNYAKISGHAKWLKSVLGKDQGLVENC